MEPVSPTSWWRCWVPALALGLLCGCAASRSRLEQALLADRDPAAHAGNATARYTIHCPDVLHLDVPGLPGVSGPHPVGPDGRLDLGVVRPRVDGLSPPEAARSVARELGIAPQRVRVAVAEFNSQHLYLFGEVEGTQRVVPYRGPETVLDLLQRTGGITPGAAPRDVQVIRANVADGKPPEVFHVDLEGIVLRKNPESNVCLEPFDQVYVGQSRRCRLSSCIPPWLLPLYRKLFGLSRPGE